MRMFDIISKKKYGEVLSKEEIDYVIKGYTEGTIPDYQMSALLMAIYFEGMTYEETSLMTLAMADSGDRLDLSGIDGINVVSTVQAVSAIRQHLYLRLLWLRVAARLQR